MQSVIVTDAEDPQIECPGDISIEVEAGRDNIPIDPGLPVTSDNVRVVSVTNNAPAFFHPGTTVVIWTAMDEAGNMASCDQTVSITTADIPEPETELSFNNIITPNGDGKNEYFIIKDLPENSELIIFDRKDKIRYQDHNYQNDWYGMDSQNIPLEDGTYWFIVITPDGQEHSGYVIVKRQ